jgi:hypothetical protein
MKKVLLVVALFLLATPVFAADVTVTATAGAISNPSEPNKLIPVTIGWTGAAEANSIRAFALVLNVDGGTNLDNIRGFKRGECNAVSRGYGIFPARFRQFIDVQNPTTADWEDPNYSPLAWWSDPNSGGGNDNPNMVVELGTLFVEPNSPGTSGTLFVVDVNSEGAGECNLCISLDQIRGGVVKKDTTAADVCLPSTGGNYGCIKIAYGVPIPNIIGMTKAAADAAISGVGLNPNGTGTMVCTGVYDTVLTQDTGSVPLGTTVNYTYETGRVVPNIVGLTGPAAQAALTAAGLTTGTITGQYSDTIPVGQVMSQTVAAGTCVANATPVGYTASLGPMPAPAQIIYPKWDADCCVPVYWSNVAGATQYRLERSANSGSTWTATVYTGTATYFGNTVTAAPTYRYRVIAKNADSNGTYLAGTFDCNAYLSTCYRGGVTTDPNWANWLSAGRPDCWCKASTAQEPNGSGYQCDGDADGATSGAPNNYRVYTGDLNFLTTHWKKKASNLTMDPNVTQAGKLKIVQTQCADLDHKSSGAPNNYRVYTGDLNILTTNWKKKNSSATPTTVNLPGTCPR